MIPAWSRLLETIDTQGAAALVSVLATAGSAPREAGARMVVRPDGGFWGTVGGGALEHALIQDALAALGGDPFAARFELRDWPLGPDLGQCCGGRVTTLVERFSAADRDAIAALAARESQGSFVTSLAVNDAGLHRAILPSGSGPEPSPGAFLERFGTDSAPLLLFGAGHVGRAVVLALAPLPFQVRWIDSRPDAFPPHNPANTEAVRSENPAAEIPRAPAGAFAVIMTHSHPLDLSIATAALARGDLGFVGLIGSATKKARFLARMRAAGLSEVQLSGLTCPIGVQGLVGKEPPVIAASLAVQLLQARQAQQSAALDHTPGARVAAPRSRLRLAGGRP